MKLNRVIPRWSTLRNWHHSKFARKSLGSLVFIGFIARVYNSLPDFLDFSFPSFLFFTALSAFLILVSEFCYKSWCPEYIRDNYEQNKFVAEAFGTRGTFDRYDEQFVIRRLICILLYGAGVLLFFWYVILFPIIKANWK